MAQLAAVPVVVNSLALVQAPEQAADDGAFDLVLAALTPDLMAPQAPGAIPAPPAKAIKLAPACEPVPEDVTKVLPRPVVVARADIKPVPPPPPKLAASKPEPLPAFKPAAPPSTDDKEPVAVAPIRPVPQITTEAAPAVADVAKAPALPVAEPAKAAPEIPAELIEAAVQAAAPEAKAEPDTKPAPSAKPDAKSAPQPQPAAGKASAPVIVVDKTARAAPQPIVQDVTQAQQIEHDAPPVPSATEQSAPQPAAEPAAQPQPAAAHQPAQVATVTPAHTPAPTPAHAMPTPVHTAPEQPELQPNLKALAVQIVAKASSGTKSFEIRLDPPELGRVEVHLTVSHDGKAEATLTAERPETVALLQRDSQNLERTLKEAGLDVSNSSLNFSLKGEERQGDGGGASRAHTRNLSDAVVARSEAVNASLASRSSAHSSARLDIFV